MHEDARYICDACGHETAIPFEVAPPGRQEIFQDCPQCSQPNVIHLVTNTKGKLRVCSHPQPTLGQSLCERCEHVRVIESQRGGRFLMCLLSKEDERFAKYPRQPRLVCAGLLIRENLE